MNCVFNSVLLYIIWFQIPVYILIIILFREHRSSRSALFDDYDGLEEGGLKMPSSYSHETKEHDNDTALDSLKEKVVFLKRVSSNSRKSFFEFLLVICYCFNLLMLLFSDLEQYKMFITRHHIF